MLIIHFIIRYIPFWAIPAFMISLQFGYTYWLKSIKNISMYFMMICLFSFISVIYWIWAGGTEGSVHTFMIFLDELKLIF